MKNRQTYLSIEDRKYLLELVKHEMDALLAKEQKVTPKLIQKVNLQQNLIDKLEAKL